MQEFVLHKSEMPEMREKEDKDKMQMHLTPVPKVNKLRLPYALCPVPIFCIIWNCVLLLYMPIILIYTLSINFQSRLLLFILYLTPSRGHEKQKTLLRE